MRSSGLGLVEYKEGKIYGVAYDLIKNPPKRPLSECLKVIQKTMTQVLEEFKPDVVAVEGVFYSKFVNTTLILGEARGVVIATAAMHDIPVYEHEPRRVKQAVAGYGAATKEQMQKMVAGMLNMTTFPPEDAADALAIAITHIQSFSRMTLQGIKTL